MLILSRRPNESICFPSLGISVCIFGVQGTRVRVGVDAPDDVNILRGELNKAGTPYSTHTPSITAVSTGQSCELRSRLSSATSDLHLAMEQVRAGQLELAEQSLAQALERLATLEREVTLQRSPHDMKVSEPLGTYTVQRQSKDRRNHLEDLLEPSPVDAWFPEPHNARRLIEDHRSSESLSV